MKKTIAVIHGVGPYGKNFTADRFPVPRPKMIAPPGFPSHRAIVTFSGLIACNRGSLQVADCRRIVKLIQRETLTWKAEGPNDGVRTWSIYSWFVAADEDLSTPGAHAVH